MKVRDFQELTLSVPNLRAYLSRLNIYKNKSSLKKDFKNSEIYTKNVC